MLPLLQPIGGFASCWYQQVQGIRQLTLVPHRDCRHSCEEMKITVEAGDLGKALLLVHSVFKLLSFFINPFNTTKM